MKRFIERKEKILSCLVCGKEVYEKEKNFACVDQKCNFSIGFNAFIKNMKV